MHLIDTHSHLYAQQFDNDRSEVIHRAKTAGIQAILLPNEDAESVRAILELCDQEPDFAFPMMGLHPTSVDGNYIQELGKIETALTKRNYFAIGEIGIDLYWDKKYHQEQKTVFKEQLQWAVELQLPVSIHLRNSFAETLDCIYQTGADRLKGVFHCFGGTTEQWDEIANLTSFLVGIGGIVTYKNNVLADTLKHIPLEKIVLETDSPYLAPVPFRGKRNEPAYLWETAKKVAECHAITTEKLAMTTARNSLELFAIPIKHVPNEKKLIC